MWKVILTPIDRVPAIVPMEWGETRYSAGGRRYSYEPVPLCRFSIPFGVPTDAIREKAERLCYLINAHGLEWETPAECSPRNDGIIEIIEEEKQTDPRPLVPVCDCGADRTGPSAEAHSTDCPAR